MRLYVHKSHLLICLSILLIAFICPSAGFSQNLQGGGSIQGTIGDNEPETWTVLDAQGNKGEVKTLIVKAKVTGQVENGKLMIQLVAPDDLPTGLVMIEEPLSEGAVPAVNKYRKGLRYTRHSEKKGDMIGRAYWLGPGDHVWMIDRKISRDAPGTIYRKGSVIAGNTLDQDMMLNQDGSLKPASDQ